MLAIFISTILCVAIELVNSSKCDRTPTATSANKSPSDGRFLLTINGDSKLDRYVPNETYNGEMKMEKLLFSQLIKLSHQKIYPSHPRLCPKTLAITGQYVHWILSDS